MKYLQSILLCSCLLWINPVVSATQAKPETGTVVEVIPASVYVYLHLKEDDKWLATGKFTISVGDKVSYTGGMEMQDFYSKSLNRSFKSVYFIQHVKRLGQAGGNPHKGVSSPHGTQMTAASVRTDIKTPLAGEVQPLKGGKTIAAVFADLDALDGSKISLNAKIMKVSKNILGKNWITLEDGSGLAAQSKLMARSLEIPVAGELVQVSGTLKADIDIGSGYHYKVLLEGAHFSPIGSKSD